MSRLEEVVAGCTVRGIMGEESVTIVSAEWHGSAMLDITYRDSSGATGSRILLREDEESIEVLGSRMPWSFDADGADMKLASEAYRIRLAHLFDPYLAVHTSSVDPLPHQISAVYQEMLPKIPLRYVLADDPGAGKTIMTGLYIKELIARGDLKRCLIVCPGNLVEQWQDELSDKFHLQFEILSNSRIQSAKSGNIFNEVNLCIARLDRLARDEELKTKLKETEWDLVVCDEAHKMSATAWGGDVKYTRRYRLGQLLSGIARNFLLLTATPHNGKNEDFQLFMALVDPDRFEGGQHAKDQVPDVSGVMRRLTKEEMFRFDGTPLFPERRAYTVNYSLSPAEAELYREVTDYVRQEFNRADRLKGDRKNTVGFALTILQRRLASSPEAIYQSLRNRRERLEQRLFEEQADQTLKEYEEHIPEDFDEDDLSPEQQEGFEDQVLDSASAAATMEELKAEIQTLKRLEQMANEVRRSGVDHKWEELSRLLQDEKTMMGENGEREKLIIFTEHKATLDYLAGKVRSLLGDDRAVVTIHGGMNRYDRKKAEELFCQDSAVRILIATDAAGEGINLQRAHLMINYDLPWNPNRIEQRFGRIHRIGQTEVCHLWNLVASETREGAVFQRLFEKLEEERKALGGKVFDILGKVSYDDKPLRELLVEAVRYGNDPEVRARLTRTVDRSMNREALQKLLDEQALTEDVMNVELVNRIREDMERMEAHRLQPHFIEAFFLEAFDRLGGRIQKRETGRYEILWVPYVLRNRSSQAGGHILERYERVCFDRKYCTVQGQPQAEQLCPGHPLLEAVTDLVQERYGDTMRQGGLFVDDGDDGTEARLLFYIEDSIEDGVTLPDGSRRVISRNVHFVELKEDGSASSAGYAPYLDYRAATAEEQSHIHSWMKSQTWLGGDVEELAVSYAEKNLLPAHCQEVKNRKEASLKKTEAAVKDRLTKEIRYWDKLARKLRDKEREGKPDPRMTSARATARADELVKRLRTRQKEIRAERRIESRPPVVTGGALVIPRGLLKKLAGTTSEEESREAESRKAVEQAAMGAVMRIECSLGYQPADVSKENRGYDIESRIPDAEERHLSHSLRMIEVKGRAKGSATVTVTRNEILTALNVEEDGREFLLALVEVDGESTRIMYLRNCFHSAPEFATESVIYNIKNLVQGSNVVYQE